MVYLINKQGEVKTVDFDRVMDVPEDEQKIIRRLSKKERALRSEGLVAVNSQGRAISQTTRKSAQHFFPLSILDYAQVMYDYIKKGKPLPVLSVDSHDTIKCDMNCVNCSSKGGKAPPLDIYPPDNFDIPLEKYKHILREIVNFSAKRGFTGVRFEQSGEGNPDLYQHRPQILAYAKELGMGCVYITTGSKINDMLLGPIIEHVDYLRISVPGIGNKEYAHYSGQKNFTFDHCIRNLERIVKERKQRSMEREMLLGVRIALRSENEGDYYQFIRVLKEIGVDAVQITKIFVPEGEEVPQSPLSELAKEQMLRSKGLEDDYFIVDLPVKKDNIFYGREIEDRSVFPDRCISAYIQPVLEGRCLFVCTKSEVMYSPSFKLGEFEGKESELEQFLAPGHISSVTKNVPAECKTCGNIFDNLLMNRLKKVAEEGGELKFYEALRH